MPLTYTPIATQTLGSAAATVTFSSIPSTYTDLVLVCNGRTATAATSDTYLMTFNSNTTSIYSRTRLLGTGSAASSAGRTGAPNIDFEGLSGNTSASGTYSVAKIQLQNYSNTTTNKTVLVRGDDANNYVLATVGLFRDTSAISTISLATSSGANFSIGSTFSLYGILAA
jgi:hypothetical protein